MELSALERFASVHPRACGELRLVEYPSLPVTGSSPRMRGTRYGARRRCAPERFIPAHAGNSTFSTINSCFTTVHPRACGELDFIPPLPSGTSGSSPRMRGTPVQPSNQRPLRRFIPAHAGNSHARSHRPSGLPVHPRACGELRSSTWSRVFSAGSSPRMRGTQCEMRAYALGQRFIPAHAGNSANCCQLRCPLSVHPRACGELQAARRSSRCAFGSSPRMRGTLSNHCIFVRYLRFIPAHAGNSLHVMIVRGELTVNPPSRITVHPRACGELSSWKLMIVNVLRDRKERTKYSLYFPGRWERVQIGRISQAKPLSDRCRMIEA